MKTLSWLGVWGGLLTLLSAPSYTSERQVTATSQLRLQVVAACQLAANSGVSAQLNFGEHSQLNHLITAQTALDASVHVRCSESTSYQITINQGLHAESVFSRRMQHSSGGEYLAYQLYQDVARTRVWDDSEGLSAVGTGALQQHVVYGALLPQITPPAGVYQDQLIITVRW